MLILICLQYVYCLSVDSVAGLFYALSVLNRANSFSWILMLMAMGQNGLACCDL